MGATLALVSLVASSGGAPVVVDHHFALQIEARVEDVAHQPVEGVSVLFRQGRQEPVEVGRTDERGLMSGRRSFLWGVADGTPQPPPVSFNLAFRKEGFREESHSFLVKDLPMNEGAYMLDSRVVLVRAARDGGPRQIGGRRSPCAPTTLAWPPQLIPGVVRTCPGDGG
jgi:hypothetical protein